MNYFEIIQNLDVLRIWHIQEFFGLTKSQAYYFIKKQKFKTMFCGNKMFVSKQDVFEYFNNQKKVNGE